jgi:hypothetical protein
MTPEFDKEFEESLQGELDLGLHDHMHYENGVLVEDTPIIERPDASQLGKTALNRWDDQGDYHRWDVT